MRADAPGCPLRRGSPPFDAHTSIGHGPAPPGPAGGAGRRRGAGCSPGRCSFGSAPPQPRRQRGAPPRRRRAPPGGAGISPRPGARHGPPRSGPQPACRPTGGPIPGPRAPPGGRDPPDPALIGVRCPPAGGPLRSTARRSAPDQPSNGAQGGGQGSTPSPLARSAPLSGLQQRSCGPSWRPEPPAARPAGPPGSTVSPSPAPPIRPGTPGRPPPGPPAQFPAPARRGGSLSRACVRGNLIWKNWRLENW